MPQRIRETLTSLLPVVAMLAVTVARRWWP